MTYEYQLSNKEVKKYGFTHLLCNGWFGVYNDIMNKKFNDNVKRYIEIELKESDIDIIMKNSLECKEY